MKTCFKCQQTKPVSEFYRHSAMADGYLGKCKECTKLDARQARESRLEYYQAYDRERGRTEARKAVNRERARLKRKEQPGCDSHRHQQDRLAHPEKYRARYLMSNAIRDGRLKRLPCEKCGDPKSHGHHYDYSKPLDVQWLCGDHHKEIHRLYA